MSSNLTYGSICSGIEAASVAWHNLPLSPVWFSETSKFPSAVLSHRFPEVPNLGDMRSIGDKLDTELVAAPDILVGGTPCQAFSIAGMRAGLADPRGGLTMAFVEIADKIDEVRSKNGQRQATILWENVPGVLSSKDNAFGCFLAGLAGEGSPLLATGGKWSNAGCVIGPKRTIAWRVLNAQYFGVAQRRKRVFVCAIDNAAGVDPTRVLFEFNGTRLDTKPPDTQGGFGTGDAGECHQKPIFIQGNAIGRKPKNGPAGKGFSDTGVCFTLNCTDRPAVCVADKGVRRLTPTEHERLQGFPDGWTDVPWSGKGLEGLRYKAVGNSMAVPVMRWIGSQLVSETIL